MLTIIERNQKRRAKEKLEALLIEGLNSGEPINADRIYWQEKRRRLIERDPNKARR